MNLRTLVLTPWRAALPSLRWLALGVFGSCLAVALAITFVWESPNADKLSLMLYGGGSVYLWAFFMPASFLLAYDARQLRMPRLERTAIASVCLYALATIAMGVALLGHAMGWATTAAVLSLAVAGGFAFSLLPRYLSTFMGLLPALIQALRRIIPLPGLADPRAALWYGTLALVFALACVVRWRRLMTQGASETGLSGAMVMQLRRSGGVSWASQQANADQLIRQRTAWLQPEADLRHTGPSSPGTSLRVALGGWFVPQTWRGLLRQALAVAWPIGMFALVMLVVRAGDGQAGHWTDFLEGFAKGGTSVLCVTAALGAPLISALMLRQRWSTPQRELSLLAVLPGLGTPEQARSALLRAALARPIAINLILAVGASGVAVSLHLSALAALAVVAGPLLCAVAGVALSLDALGDHPLPGWALGLTCFFMTVVVFTTGFTALIASQLRQGGEWATSPLLWGAFIGMVLLVAGMLLWIGRRAARTFFAQPHPFLAHA